MPREKTDSSHLKGLLGHANIRSSVAVYKQIETVVRCAIASGTLKEKDQLPTVRELAEWLSVNQNTVAKAYRDLEIMGLLYTRRGMGIYVKNGVRGHCNNRLKAEIITRIFEVCAEAKATGIAPLEIKMIAKECYKVGTAPYSEVPKELLALAKRKK